MSLRSRLFGKKDNITTSEQEFDSIQSDNPSVKAIIELNKHISNLLSSDSYIAKSEYLKFIEARKEAVLYFKQLNKDKLLKNFCSNNHITTELVLDTIEKLDNLKNLVSQHNKNFIESKLISEKNISG